MTYFAIGLRMAATIYIKANSLSEAKRKLQPFIPKCVDARDGRWFSNASFGSPALPEISFSTAMTILGAEPGSVCQPINLDQVSRLMCSSPDARKSAVLPHSKENRFETTKAIYWADICVRTIGIVKCGDVSDALGLLANIQDTPVGVHWELADEWFETKGFANAEVPLVLAPNIELLSVSNELPLQEHWSVGSRI